MMVLMQAMAGRKLLVFQECGPVEEAAYRWFRKFRKRGEAACQDGRHRHHAKVRASLLRWLEG